MPALVNGNETDLLTNDTTATIREVRPVARVESRWLVGNDDFGQLGEKPGRKLLREIGAELRNGTDYWLVEARIIGAVAKKTATLIALETRDGSICYATSCLFDRASLGEFRIALLATYVGPDRASGEERRHVHYVTDWPALGEADETLAARVRAQLPPVSARDRSNRRPVEADFPFLSTFTRKRLKLNLPVALVLEELAA